MARVSRPLIGLLVATVAFFALWVTMLKPSSPTSGTNAGNIAKNPSLGQLGGAVSAAHAAVGTANAASVRHGGTIATTSTTSRTASTGAHLATTAPGATLSGSKRAPARHAVVRSRTAVHVRAHPARRVHVVRASTHLTAAGRLARVRRALAAHKVLALLFFNSAAADDRAVGRELAAVPVHRGAVVKIAVPLAEVASYSSLAAQSPINTSPTLLIIDRTRNATEIVGFTDRFEIAQRVAHAVAAK